MCSSDLKPATLPLLVTSQPGSALRGSPAVAVAAGVLRELQPWLAKQVAQVRPAPVAAGTEQVTLSLRDGKTVQWGGTDRAAQKNRELAILLPGGARDIDVSSAGTVVTRLFTLPRPVRKSGRRYISTSRRAKCAGPGLPVTGFRRCGPQHARSGSVAS